MALDSDVARYHRQGSFRLGLGTLLLTAALAALPIRSYAGHPAVTAGKSSIPVLGLPRAQPFRPAVNQGYADNLFEVETTRLYDYICRLASQVGGNQDISGLQIGGKARFGSEIVPVKINVVSAKRDDTTSCEYMGIEGTIDGTKYERLVLGCGEPPQRNIPIAADPESADYILELNPSWSFVPVLAAVTKKNLLEEQIERGYPKKSRANGVDTETLIWRDGGMIKRQIIEHHPRIVGNKRVTVNLIYLAERTEGTDWTSTNPGLAVDPVFFIVDDQYGSRRFGIPDFVGGQRSDHPGYNVISIAPGTEIALRATADEYGWVRDARDLLGRLEGSAYEHLKAAGDGLLRMPERRR